MNRHHYRAITLWVGAFGASNLGLIHHYHGSDVGTVAGGLVLLLFVALALREERKAGV